MACTRTCRRGSAKEDASHCVYLSFLCCGAGLLFPFFAVVSSEDYFRFVLRENDALNSTNNSTTNFNQMFPLGLEFYFSAAYNVGSLLFFIPILTAGPRISFRLRVVGGFSIQLAVVIILPILLQVLSSAHISSDESKYALRLISFCVVLSLLAITGAMAGLLASALLGLAALFPPRYTQAVQQGAGLSAVVLSLLRIVSLIAIPATKNRYEKVMCFCCRLLFAVWI